MVSLTTTQFWIMAVVVVLVLALIGWLISHFAMKATASSSRDWMYAGIGALIGAIIAAIVWFTMMKKPATGGYNM